MLRFCWRRVVLLAVLAWLGAASRCRADFRGLGTASNYGVLGLQGTAIDNNLVTINGNEGVSAGGSLTNMAPSTVTGNVYELADLDRKRVECLHRQRLG